MEYKRENNLEIKPLERIKNFNEFHVPMSEEERSVQASRCMDCGVPFCQSGMNRHLADCLRQIIFRNLLPVSARLHVRQHVPVD